MNENFDLSGQNTMNDFDLFASETEIVERPYCQYEFLLDDIECVDTRIEAERMIESDRKGTLVCINNDCKKPFYFKGFIEYRYASKKLESKND